jgi:hypothetical protein
MKISYARLATKPEMGTVGVINLTVQKVFNIRKFKKSENVVLIEIHRTHKILNIVQMPLQIAHQCPGNEAYLKTLFVNKNSFYVSICKFSSTRAYNFKT